MSSSNATCIRPISVMSLLADQLESSSLGENKACDNDERGIPINNPYKYDLDFKNIDNSNSRTNNNISTSVPSHRHSFSSGCCNFISNPSDLMTDHGCVAYLESDLLNTELPPKRKCHSVSSTNDHISRPIPIKIIMNPQNNQNVYVTNSHDSSYRFNRTLTHRSLDDQPKSQHISRVTSASVCKKPILCQNQRNNCGTTLNRPVIFAHKRSAFIPTRSLTSPHTSSSDYSISPDIDSPTHRPDSVTSSGFHDCSQQSLLIDPNYSPDANQRSGCATIINSVNKPIEPSPVVFPRCHSQPCYGPLSRNITTNGKPFTCQKELNNIRTNSQFHVPLKRRYPSLTQILPTNNSEVNHQRNSSTPMQYCNKRVTSSADTSPSAYGSAYSFKRDGYFFGNGRSYLVSLPRIASSPTPISPQSNSNSQKEEPLKESDQTELLTIHQQRIGSNSSSLSTSTTTDTTMVYQKISSLLDNQLSTNKENFEDVDMMETGEYQIENRSNPKVKLDYHSHSLSTNDGLYNMTLSPVKDQMQFWENQNFPKSRNSISSCSVSATSDITTKSYSTNSDDTSNGTNASNSIGNSNCESSRSEYRDPDDPPEIFGDALVSNVSSIGFCFRQLTNHPDLMNYNDSSSFQELDLDQIELD